METLAQTCARFYDVTAIPLSCRAQSGEALFRHPAWACDLSPAFLGRLALFKAAPALAEMRPLILTAGPQHMLAGIPLDGSQVIVLGPVNISMTQGHPPPVFEALSNQPPIVQMSYARFLNAVLLLTQLCTGRAYDPAQLLPVDTAPWVAEEVPDEDQQLSRADEASPQLDFHLHPGETYEHRFLQAIESGDTAALLAILQTAVDFPLDQMSFNPLQQQKFLFVMFMTMAERAAIRGGLPSADAFAISHEYCRRMDRSEDIPKIASLLLKMAEELSEGVRKHSKRSGYSPPVRACCDYIHAHLYAPVSLADLARIAGLCERSISQRFRAEVGRSPIDYIHAERVEVARFLLRHTAYSIADISVSLQFSSQSHFTRVFREHAGTTPRLYRAGQSEI